MRSCLILLLLFILSEADAQAPLELSWKDLIPADLVLDDPFEKLNPEEVENLFTVARYRLLEEYSPESVSETIQLEKDSLEKWLTTEGVATDSLIALSIKIAEMREKTSQLFLVDGSDNITSGYSLQESTVSPYLH